MRRRGAWRRGNQGDSGRQRNSSNIVGGEIVDSDGDADGNVDDDDDDDGDDGGGNAYFQVRRNTPTVSRPRCGWAS